MNASFPTSKASLAKARPSMPVKEQSDVSISRLISDSDSSSIDSKISVGKTDGLDDRKSATYRDYSHIAPSKTDSSPLRAKGKEETFPVKLHRILSSQQFRHVITWLPHGRAWKIIDQTVFEKEVIPLFFRHDQYTSFSRQVNAWGFRRIAQGSDANSYFHELFLRGMPHLTERMKRVTRDEAARAKSERPPDFDAINRAKPLPKDPSPPAIPSKNIDEFISTLSDEEARFLARRRKEMLDRAAQVASANRDSPNLPTSAKDIGAYLSTLSDEEVLVLAHRREQELRVLQSKLGQLVQRRQAPLPPRYIPAVRASQHVAGNIETINGLTHEEKLLLACHRAQRLSSVGLKNVDMLAQERARWEKMKNDLHASSMTAALLEQTHQAAQRSLPSNVLMQSNNSLSPHRRQCETSSFPPDLHRQGTTQGSEMEAVIRLDNFRRRSNRSVPSEFEAAILECAHQAKLQADGFAVDGAYHRVPRPSQRLDESVVARSCQSQLQNDYLSSTSQGKVRRDSLSVVKEALDALHRADRFVGSQNASIQQAHPTGAAKAAPARLSSTFGARNSLQEDILLDETQVNAVAVQEPVSTFRERKGEIGVAEFLAMKKGGRRAMTQIW